MGRSRGLLGSHHACSTYPTLYTVAFKKSHNISFLLLADSGNEGDHTRRDDHVSTHEHDPTSPNILELISWSLYAISVCNIYRSKLAIKQPQIMANPPPCKHTTLQLSPSPFAELAGFQRPDTRARIAATTKSGRGPPAKSSPSLKDAQKESQTYPAPLVLPHDALNYDPDGDEPAQSFRSWLHESHRNKLTPERRTLYVGAAPRIDEKVGFMKEWMVPGTKAGEPLSKKTPIGKGTKYLGDQPALERPNVNETMEYLRAFYHGLEVKRLPIDLKWVPWKEKGRTAQTVNGVAKYVALSYGDAATRVRARPAPDGIFPAQLNLEDILDAAIAMLPSDAYAIVLLVDHDIYESDDDDFCAGRAYGGSRVSVVQTARYNPLLDDTLRISGHHAWPTSHCKAYVDSLCAVEDMEAKPATATESRLSKSGPVRAAVDAVVNLRITDSKDDLEAVWSSRVLRTVSHELGHCLCLAHCCYYACIMQSTSSLLEDTRQPPYLCPVCDSKISHMIVVELQGGKEEDKRRWICARYSALRSFCTTEERKKAVLWAGLGAWIGATLGTMNV